MCTVDVSPLSGGWSVFFFSPSGIARQVFPRNVRSLIIVRAGGGDVADRLTRVRIDGAVAEEELVVLPVAFRGLRGLDPHLGHDLAAVAVSVVGLVPS